MAPGKYAGAAANQQDGPSRKGQVAENPVGGEWRRYIVIYFSEAITAANLRETDFILKPRRGNRVQTFQ